MAHRPAVVRRKLLAALERRKRLAHLHSLPPRSIYMPLARVRDAPPVRRGVEDTREERGLRRPREKVVDVRILVFHPERAVLAPVGMLVVRKRAEHREDVHAGGRQVLCVLLLRLPLPEHHCRNGFPVVVQPRCAVQLGDTPAPCNDCLYDGVFVIADDDAPGGKRLHGVALLLRAAAGVHLATARSERFQEVARLLVRNRQHHRVKVVERAVLQLAG